MVCVEVLVQIFQAREYAIDVIVLRYASNLSAEFNSVNVLYNYNTLELELKLKLKLHKT